MKRAKMLRSKLARALAGISPEMHSACPGVYARASLSVAHYQRLLQAAEAAQVRRSHSVHFPT